MVKRGSPSKNRKTSPVVLEKCLGLSSTNASGPDPLACSVRVPLFLLLKKVVLFLVVARRRIRCLGTLGGPRTSGTAQ